MIAGVLLAAGKGRRFGSDKLLHTFRGKPLFYHSLRHALDSRLSAVHIVVGPQSARLERAMARYFPGEGRLRIVRNRHASRGQMSSVKAGLRSLDPSTEGAMILLGDMPFVVPEIIDALLDAAASGEILVVPECGGILRHPRIIPRVYFGEFYELGDDGKGQAVFERMREKSVMVSVGTSADYRDIDFPGDIGSLP